MNELENKIILEINQKGPITFERFMEIALYDKEHGYYGSGRAEIGRKGDFYTGPSVNKAFGQTIATFLVCILETFNTGNYEIIEAGAGKGLLSMDILNHLKTHYPEVYKRLRYTVVESGGRFMDNSRELLSIHSDITEFKSNILDVEPKETGIVISNELFDALPFHRLKFEDGKLKEIFVTYRNNRICEITDLPSDKRLGEYIDRYGIQLYQGQQFEINLNAEKMLDSLSSRLGKGVVLTIDYGYTADELFTPDRPRGTYKCHYKHEINETPYINIGQQDITSHVDFSNIIYSGEKLGMNNYILKEQGQFLVDWGILKFAEDPESGSKDSCVDQKKRLGIKNLILPQLMGRVFKVLIQFKNLPVIPEDIYPESELRLV